MNTNMFFFFRFVFPSCETSHPFLWTTGLWPRPPSLFCMRLTDHCARDGVWEEPWERPSHNTACLSKTRSLRLSSRRIRMRSRVSIFCFCCLLVFQSPVWPKGKGYAGWTGIWVKSNKRNWVADWTLNLRVKTSAHYHRPLHNHTFYWYLDFYSPLRVWVYILVKFLHPKT